MFCSECGVSINNDAKFCVVCGAAQLNSEQLPKQPTANADLTTNAISSSGNVPLAYIKAIGAIIVIVAIVVIIYFVSSKNEDASVVTASEDTQVVATSEDTQAVVVPRQTAEEKARLAAEGERMRVASVERESTVGKQESAELREQAQKRLADEESKGNAEEEQKKLAYAKKVLQIAGESKREYENLRAKELELLKEGDLLAQKKAKEVTPATDQQNADMSSIMNEAYIYGGVYSEFNSFIYAQGGPLLAEKFGGLFQNCQNAEYDFQTLTQNISEFQKDENLQNYCKEIVPKEDYSSYGDTWFLLHTCKNIMGTMSNETWQRGSQALTACQNKIIAEVIERKERAEEVERKKRLNSIKIACANNANTCFAKAVDVQRESVRAATCVYMRASYLGSQRAKLELAKMTSFNPILSMVDCGWLNQLMKN